MGTLQASYNQGGFMGTSDDAEVELIRNEASADYMVARLQLARLQSLFGTRDESGRPEGRWLLFSKFEGQVSDGPLVPAEQIAVGGARTVRGYLEREFLGDDGAMATLEMRTPILLGLFSNMMGSGTIRENGVPVDRFQSVLFLDGGYTKIKEALQGEEPDQTIASVGLGFRLAITRYTQMRADWGFPLVETEESSTGGAGHIEVQAQF